MYCLHCFRQTKWLKTDKTKKTDEGTVRQWKCGTCGRLQDGYVSHQVQKGRELYFDIETCFNVVAAFDLRVKSGYISPDAILKPGFIICWSAGWVGEKEIFSGIVTSAQAKKGDDSQIIKPLWKLLSKADVVIGHNSDSFDIKKLNYRFLIHGFEPPTKYRTVDTRKVARKNFAAESNKMDYLSGRLNGIRKPKMELQDWIDCAAGIPDALNRMARYNKNDVKEGMQLYQKMLSWIPVQTGQMVRAEAMR